MNRILVLCRGLPASGKSTQTLEWVNKDPLNRARCNRDEMRNALYGRYAGLDRKQEKAVTEAQRAVVRSLLDSGKAVVVDDDNLELKDARAWADLAEQVGAPLRVIEVETDVEECIRRDKLRGEAGGKYVGEKAIREAARRFGDRREPVTPTSADTETAKWEPESGLPWCWIFDLDGTLAHNNGHRGWYEYGKVFDDTPWDEVVLIAKALLHYQQNLIFMTGRSETCRAETVAWIEEHIGIRVDESRLLMRKAGDRRKDTVIKTELFDAHIRGKWNVRAALEDRPSVTRMWRQTGLRVLQCGDPYHEF